VSEIRLSDHPRAPAAIRRAKGLAGLGAFVLVLLLSLRAGLTPDEALARALPAGIVAYLIAWGVAVTVWRQLVIGEIEGARARHAARAAAVRGELADG
jgi:uncharacterized membrane protein YccC